jgi:hypothetical protein
MINSAKNEFTVVVALMVLLTVFIVGYWPQPAQPPKAAPDRMRWEYRSPNTQNRTHTSGHGYWIRKAERRYGSQHSTAGRTD